MEERSQHIALQALWALATCLVAGCESTGGGAVVGQAPISGADSREVGYAARTVEMQVPDRVSGPGTGQSMAPLYGSNSYVVVDPINFYDLEPGMVVAYRDSEGRNVAHQLVRKEGFYWVVEGINNQQVDGERVTPENLIGVVYATFHGRP